MVIFIILILKLEIQFENILAMNIIENNFRKQKNLKQIDNKNKYSYKSQTNCNKDEIHIKHLIQFYQSDVLENLNELNKL